MADSKYKVPPLPQVMIQVMQYDHTSTAADPSGLEKVIAPDKGISSEILRVSNSAYYGRSGKIKNLRDALTLLGLKAAKNLVIFISTKGLTANLKGKVFQKYLHEFPIVCALMARDIATAMKQPNVADDAFMAGLLHNIGMSILAINKGDHYSFLIEQSEQNGWNLQEREQSAYKTDHVVLGLDVCNEWKLPSEIREAVEVSNGGSAKAGSIIPMVSMISAVMTRKALNLPLNAEKFSEAETLLKNGGVSSGSAFFINDGYLKRLKEHPYYKMAMGI